MILSVSECIEAFKREHPDLYPIWYVEDGGAYLFNCLKRGVSRDEAMSSFYVADPTDGRIYGPVPVMGILDNEELAKKLENPHMIDGEDQLLEHSSMGNRVGRYSVRRKGSRNTDCRFLNRKTESNAASGHYGRDKAKPYLYTDYLMHYGIKGQKWGVRRFQNEDGTWTAM